MKDYIIWMFYPYPGISTGTWENIHDSISAECGYSGWDEPVQNTSTEEFENRAEISFDKSKNVKELCIEMASIVCREANRYTPVRFKIEEIVKLDEFVVEEKDIVI